MKVSAAKENILKKIRKALADPAPLPFPQSEGNSAVVPAPAQELEIEFAEQFTKLQGKFVFCMDDAELAAQLGALVQQQGWKEMYCSEPVLQEKLRQNGYAQFTQQALARCDAGITSCELLVARTGSVVLSAAQRSGRTVSVYAPVHICIAYMHQLVYDVKDGLQLLKEKYAGQLPSLITFATGPSRTADIEKTLVVGVHGPREVYVFLVEQGG
jgi:L-lactate dehydrogenase complex protein LldG